MSLAIGAIADDLTGATDLAGAFVSRGLRTAISIGPGGVERGPHDAVVVALKSRSIAPGDAAAVSLEALATLTDAGAGQIYFKYCSTFDSTPAGNIGPVADALASALGETQLLHCPTFPETGRAVMGGELFVNGVPLASTSMRHHPINPMTESDLVKVLARQTSAKVGLLPLQVVRQGPRAIDEHLNRLARRGVRHVIVDAVNHDDLAAAARAASGMRLAAGATGFGEAVAARVGGRVKLRPLEVPTGATVVLAGSCSETTLAQLEAAASTGPLFRLDVKAIARGDDEGGSAIAWAAGRLAGCGTLIIAASAGPGERVSHESAIGGRIEQVFGAIAAALAKKGVRRFVVAGGETSGAVVAALGIATLCVGPQIDPGVPVVTTGGADAIALILKSGNFGRRDLFIDPYGRQLWQT